jgi:lipoprotein-anchoring transpeptidase ErfK/SrfK
MIKRYLGAFIVLLTLAATSISAVYAVAPQGPAPRAVRAVVELSKQQAKFYDRAGALLRTSPISSGAVQTPTPTGTFRVWKHKAETFSATNPDVRMSYMTNFSGSIGFHGIPFTREAGIKHPLYTPLGVYGISHGCIRMRNVDARWVYVHLVIGAVVEVRP